MKRNARSRLAISSLCLGAVLGSVITAMLMLSHTAMADGFNSSELSQAINAYLSRKAELLKDNIEIQAAVERSNSLSEEPDCAVEELEVLLAEQDLETAQAVLEDANQALMECQMGGDPCPPEPPMPPMAEQSVLIAN